MSIVIGHGVPLVSSLNFYAPDRHLACHKHSGCIRTARCPFPDHSHLPMPSDDWSKKPRWTSFLEMWEGFPTNGGFGTKQTHGVFPTKKWTMTWDVKWGETPPFLGNTHKKCRKHWDFTSGRMDGCRVVSFISSRTRKHIPPKREVSENHRLHSKVPERVGWYTWTVPRKVSFLASRIIQIWHQSYPPLTTCESWTTSTAFSPWNTRSHLASEKLTIKGTPLEFLGGVPPVK